MMLNLSNAPLKTAWPTKISVPFFSSLGNYIIFQGVDYFEIEHKTY